VECLLAHLDAEAPAPAMANLHEAANHAAEYGASTAALGASLSEGVQTFLRFRAPFIAELAATARKRGLDTREATGLLVDAESAFDELLLAFMEGRQHGGVRRKCFGKGGREPATRWGSGCVKPGGVCAPRRPWPSSRLCSSRPTWVSSTGRW